MKRRDILTGFLSLGALGLARPASPRPVSRPAAPAALWLQDTRIAGAAYYRFGAVAAQLEPGHTLTLYRQADNDYDGRAIEVFWKQEKLGYLPRLDNAAAASLLDRGHSLRAEVLEVLDPAEAWEPITIRLWLEHAA